MKKNNSEQVSLIVRSVILSIIILVTLYCVFWRNMQKPKTNIISDNTKTFIEIDYEEYSDTEISEITYYYHFETRVVYAMVKTNNNTFEENGTFIMIVEKNGKPMIYNAK